MATAAASPAIPGPPLAADLRDRDDAAIVALLRERPDLAVPLPPDLTALAVRASTRTSILRAVEGLDAAGWHVLQGLLVLAEPTTFAALRRVLGDPVEPELRPVVDRLSSLALVWGPDAALQVPDRLRELAGDYPAGLGPPVYTLLLGSARLPGILERLGLAPTGDPAADAAAVSDAFGTPTTLARVLDAVDEPARRTLGQLAWGPPVGRIPAVDRSLGTTDAQGGIDLLVARGLLVPVGPDRVLLPREVGLHLRGGVVSDSISLLPPPLEVDSHDPTVVDQVAAGSAASFVRHVTALLERWSAAPPAQLRAGGLGVRDLRAGAQALGLDETETAFVAEVAYAAGLIGLAGDAEPAWAPTPEYDRWRGTEIADQWALLATAWLESSRAAGLAGGRDDRDRRIAPLGFDLVRASVAPVRRDVLTVLADAAPGAAPSLESLQASVEWRTPRRASGRQRSVVDWTRREAAQLGVTGINALATHGRALLTPDYAPTATVAAASRTPAAAEISAARAAAAAALAPLLPAPVDFVLIQADLTAIAPGPLVSDLAGELALAAEVESTGGATVYRFTAGSLRRAFDAGRSAADLRRLLETASRTPVPQPLHYLVDDVARRHGRVRVSSVKSVIRVDDEAVTDLLLGDRSLAALGLRRLAASVLSSQRPAEAVVELMRDSGHSPILEGPGGELLIGKQRVHRAPRSRGTHRQRFDRAATTGHALGAAIRSLRAGERARQGQRSGADATRRALVPRRPADTLAVLTAALDGGQPVWIDYVDNNGSTSQRLVDPIRVEGGSLTAYDHARGAVRTFAVHRVRGAATVDDADQVATEPA